MDCDRKKNLFSCLPYTTLICLDLWHGVRILEVKDDFVISQKMFLAINNQFAHLYPENQRATSPWRHNVLLQHSGPHSTLNSGTDWQIVNIFHIWSATQLPHWFCWFLHHVTKPSVWLGMDGSYYWAEPMANKKYKGLDKRVESICFVVFFCFYVSLFSFSFYWLADSNYGVALPRSWIVRIWLCQSYSNLALKPIIQIALYLKTIMYWAFIIPLHFKSRVSQTPISPQLLSSLFYLFIHFFSNPHILYYWYELHFPQI